MSEVTYLLEASTDTVIYDPDAEEGSRLSPSRITLFAYQIVDGVKSEYGPWKFIAEANHEGPPYTAYRWENQWTVGPPTTFSFNLPSDVDTTWTLSARMYSMDDHSVILATIDIPIVTLEVGEVIGEVERIDGELEGELISVLPALSGVIETDDEALVISGDLVIQATTEVDVPLYDGSYEVSPLAGVEVILPTSGKRLEDDVTVLGIPYYETTNESGGYTVIIG